MNSVSNITAPVYMPPHTVEFLQASAQPDTTPADLVLAAVWYSPIARESNPAITHALVQARTSRRFA